MKFASAVVLALVAATSNAAKNGLRRQLEKEHKRLPPGFMPVPLPTPPAPSVPDATEPQACDPSLEGDFEETEYVVLEYDKKVTPDCFDLEDSSTLSVIADAYDEAYSSTCTSYGSFCELDSVELVAYDKSTLLLKLSSNCNAGLYFDDDRDSCGVDLYSEEGFNITDLEDSETCSCAGPTASGVVELMNKAIVESRSCDPPGEDETTLEPMELLWITATEQLCEIACHNRTEDVGYTYDEDGVSPPCKGSSITYKPTRQPTREPTRNPTGEPTRNPTGKPTFSPDINPTPAPTSSPTEASTSTDPPEINPTPAPTSSPTSASSSIGSKMNPKESDAPTMTPFSPQETDAPTMTPEETDAPETDPPETDPPQTDPPQTDPPQTDPPS
eukprot:CAMPEP_0172393328 /NCGR_PEP_ID=MMETSP1061-20121228/9217_1 /TAXON_ID=37318 /ORGANISM="Pseudo-nitzschia pungens, Strain cf. pungens" /LENGTH=386 /DNA_ID=CAMNT_0013124365 /DNA_START=173 /DNA_END=1333 /DNA_ORIENTATION=+